MVPSIEYNPSNSNWDSTCLWNDPLGQNPCIRSINFGDPGFFFLTGDPWYRTASGVGIDLARYTRDPPLAGTQGHCLPRQSHGNVHFSAEDGFGIVHSRNQWRRATPEELREHLGFLPCRSPDCVDEKAAFGLDDNGNPLRDFLEARATTVDSIEKETEAA